MPVAGDEWLGEHDVLGAKSFFIDGEIATLDVRVSLMSECPAGTGLFVVSGELNQHPDGG